MMLLSKIDRALSGGRGRKSEDDAARDVAEAAGLIGTHYEAINGGLDKLAGLAEQLRNLGPVLNEMRQPLAAEFETRRTEYIELVGLRASYIECQERIDCLTTENSRLGDVLSTVETHSRELTARLGEQEILNQEARLEIDRLRTALAQSDALAQSLTSSERNSGLRIRQFEEDLHTLRGRLEEADAARAEAITGKSYAQRDHALVSDENAALKKRSEELVGEIARQARVEASLESQLAAERARASSDQTESARAVRVFEGQIDAARKETVALKVRLDTLTARADRLESLNTGLAASLADSQSAAQGGERRSGHLQVDLDRALERVRELESEADQAQQRLTAMDAARLAAVDRADGLAKSAASVDKAMSRSQERVKKLQDRLVALKTEGDERVKGLTEQIDAMRSNLEGARADSAMTIAALETARRERAAMEIQSAVSSAPMLATA